MARINLPGLIDIHVHLREPGATQKEDFNTGTRAALKGGFTQIIDMPNNPEPTITLEKLEEKVSLAKAKSNCDIGFHYGTNGTNTGSFKKAIDQSKVYGLKLYCNHTTGEMLLEDLALLENVFKSWESDKPILVHAEGVELAATISLSHLYERRLHVCHISQATEVELVARAKEKGFRITAGVCPHHLFLTEKDREKMGPWAIMKPPLGNEKDREALWRGLTSGVIDLVETDHAPHTKKEKESETPPYGVPGLETAVPLLYKAVEEGMIEEELIPLLLHDRPEAIFSLPSQEKTGIELLTGTFTIGEESFETKCGWSPFDGWKVPVRVDRVMFHGKQVLKNGRLLI